MEIPIDWNVIAGLGIPSVTAVFFVARFFNKRAQCITALKNKVENLEGVALSSGKTHDDIYNELTDQGRKIANIEGKVDIILKKI